MNVTAQEERLDISSHMTCELPKYDLLVSARMVTGSEADISVGHLGRPNSVAELEVGDYISFPKSDVEVFEIRLLRLWKGTEVKYGKLWAVNRATLLIRPIPVGTFADSGLIQIVPTATAAPDAGNFTASDLERIHRAVEELRSAVRTFNPVPQSLSEIDAQLDRMEQAATKLCRRDWITLVLGTITNIVVVGALGPDPARSLFMLVQRLINWCFSSAPSLL